MSLNQALGRGSVVKLGETEYRLSGLTKGVQGDFEDWYVNRLKSHAKDDLELKAAIAERRAAGTYAFWSPVTLGAIGKPDGAVKLLHLLFKENHPGLKETDVLTLWEQHPTELGEALTEALDLGNPPAPAAKS